MNKYTNTVKIGIVAACFAFLGLVSVPSLCLSENTLAAPTDEMQKGLDKIGVDKKDTLEGGVKTIINVMLYVLGAIAVVMIVYGGITYTVSNGNPENIKKAKNIIMYSVIGLVVALLAYAIVNFVVTAFVR